MASKSNVLILFTRFPVAGSTKTRLIPVLGEDGAAALQRRLTEQAVAVADSVCTRCHLLLEIHFHGGDQTTMAGWLGPRTYRLQADGNIGERMQQAFTDSFSRGMGQVVLIGTDCPGLTEEILQQAFLRLTDHDVVVGPALDGGYYLIGLNNPQPSLFIDIDWGTPRVLQQTLTKAKALKVSQLTALHDIDRPQDLVHLGYHPCPQ